MFVSVFHVCISVLCVYLYFMYAFLFYVCVCIFVLCILLYYIIILLLPHLDKDYLLIYFSVNKCPSPNRNKNVAVLFYCKNGLICAPVSKILPTRYRLNGSRSRGSVQK